jgi:hypothetical protein
VIEVTDEMREAFQVAAGWPGPPWRFGPDVANGLAAVLALVERDHPEIERARQDEIEAGWSEMHAQAAQDEEPF